MTNGLVVDADYSKSSLLEIRVIAEIVKSLMANPALYYSKTLPQTLSSLGRMLQLAELAVRAYQHTALVGTVSRVIIVLVQNCRLILRELLNDLSNYRHALSAAMLYFIRQYMWSQAGEAVAISAIDSKLRECHSSFAACILALGW